MEFPTKASSCPCRFAAVCGGGAPECDGASTAAGVTHVTRGAAVMVGRRDNICAYSIYWVTYGYIYIWGLLGE